MVFVSLPTWNEFSSAAVNAKVLALTATIHFDLETAISLADRFVDEDCFFLLESATAGPGGIARYSFLGFDPLVHFQLSEDRLAWSIAGKTHEEARNGQDPMSVLRSLHAGLGLKVVGVTKQRQDLVDLCYKGGFAGYISYDAMTCWEPKVGAMPPKQFDLPDMHFMLPRNFLVLDQLSRKLTLVRYAMVQDLKEPLLKKLYAEEVKAFGALINRVRTPHRVPELLVVDQPIDHAAFTGSVPEARFYELVEHCLQQIREGEAYQIQIGNRLQKTTDASPFHVFRHLRMLNPSPYMAFYKVGVHHIICASPEMMVTVDKDKVTHRPIAGTRRRTWDSARDAEIKQELKEDAKERSEHVMLVDLARNDIGRIATPGSVRVDEIMTVEEYSHVFHLVSQVTGTLRQDQDAFSAMVASFPNGTVSGAPKIRSMQLINGMEPVSREFYAGSLGIFDFHGNLRSTLLIRTIYMGNGIAATQASAGIVYDSIPKHEWQETRNKMAACLLAIQNTLGASNLP